MQALTSTQKRQERRIRWQNGLTTTRARLIASLHFGDAQLFPAMMYVCPDSRLQ